MLYQETLAPKGGKGRDLISILALLLAVIVIEMSGAKLDRDMPWVFALSHLISFLALVIFCVLFYRFRITGFRYSFTLEEKDDDGDDENDDKIELPPVGTFAAERTVGDVGSCIDIVAPDELRALIPYSKDDSRIKSLKRRERATRLSTNTAHVLIYERDGREYGIIMHPSDELFEHLSTFIKERQKYDTR